MQRTFQHWIATKWLEIDQDNLHTKFSALNVDFSSPSPDPLGSRRSAQAGVKNNYSTKKWLFLPQLSCVAWKRLQIHVGTDMLLIITNTGDRVFRFINIDDLERPWTPPEKTVFSEFFTIFGCSAHFNTELWHNGWRETKTICIRNFQH